MLIPIPEKDGGNNIHITEQTAPHLEIDLGCSQGRHLHTAEKSVLSALAETDKVKVCGAQRHTDEQHSP